MWIDEADILFDSLRTLSEDLFWDGYHGYYSVTWGGLLCLTGLIIRLHHSIGNYRSSKSNRSSYFIGTGSFIAPDSCLNLVRHNDRNVIICFLWAWPVRVHVLLKVYFQAVQYLICCCSHVFFFIHCSDDLLQSSLTFLNRLYKLYEVFLNILYISSSCMLSLVYSALYVWNQLFSLWSH